MIIEWLLFVVVIPLTILSLLAAIGVYKKRVSVLYLASLILFVLSVVTTQPLLALQALLVLLAVGICEGTKRRMRTAFACSAIAALMIPAWSLKWGYDRMAEIEGWQREFPVESLATRFAAERRVRDAIEQSEPVTLSPRVESRLSGMEQRREDHYSRRADELERLHSNTSAEFARATGFGPMRMRTLARYRLELPQYDPVPQVCRDDIQERLEGLVMEEIPLRPQPENFQLMDLHQNGLETFLDQDRMGFVKDLDHVTGFESHRFDRHLHLAEIASDTENVPEGSSAWQVARLEMVGLLQHDEPVVYVTEYLPDLDKLGDAATRPLDDFEASALLQLRTDEDLVIHSEPGYVRMLGSLRASNDCRDCHMVQRGELVGAFSYHLLPEHLLSQAE